MLTISVWPRRLKEFLLTHPLYKSPCRKTGLAPIRALSHRRRVTAIHQPMGGPEWALRAVT